MPNGAPFAPGLGAPGTRITRKLGPESDLWLYVWQACVGAAALDLVLFLLMASCAIVGWLSVPIVLSATGFLTSLIIILFGRPSRQAGQFIVGNLWGIGLLAGLVLGQGWWAFLSEGLSWIGDELAAILSFHWAIWVAIGVAWAALALYKLLKPATAIVAVGLAGWVVYNFDAETWASAWQHLKWLLLPYLWPVGGFALLLSIVMGKEMLFPSLEWTFKPVSLEELKEVGLIGLWFPRLMGHLPEPAPPEREFIVTTHDAPTKQVQRPRLPDTPEMWAFLRALHGGATFSERTAATCTLSRKEWQHIRDVFRDRRWAVWNHPRHKKQGLSLTRVGAQTIEELVLKGKGKSPPY